jgi:hypothetical protein
MFFLDIVITQRVSNEAQFCGDVKEVHNSCINECPKKFSEKNVFAKNLKSLKIKFFVKFFCYRLTQELCTFLEPAQNCASFVPFVDNLEEILFNFYWEKKGQIR